MPNPRCSPSRRPAQSILPTSPSARSARRCASSRRPACRRAIPDRNQVGANRARATGRCRRARAGSVAGAALRRSRHADTVAHLHAADVRARPPPRRRCRRDPGSGPCFMPVSVPPTAAAVGGAADRRSGEPPGCRARRPRWSNRGWSPRCGPRPAAGHRAQGRPAASSGGDRCHATSRRGTRGVTTAGPDACAGLAWAGAPPPTVSAAPAAAAAAPFFKRRRRESPAGRMVMVGSFTRSRFHRCLERSAAELASTCDGGPQCKQRLLPLRYRATHDSGAIGARTTAACPMHTPGLE